MRRLTLPAVLVVLVLAGCGGSGTQETTAPVGPQLPKPAAAPGAGEALRAFIEAAARKDTPAMWGLMTRRAQVLFGPTAAAFGKGLGKEMGSTLGAFKLHGTYTVALAVRATSEWAVAAVAGDVKSPTLTSYAAYAVPAKREGGGWKLELGGSVAFNPLTPDEGLTTSSTPDVATQLQASEPVLEQKIWVDGLPIAAQLSPDGMLMNGQVTRALTPGRHVIVAFATTQSSAGATAFTFTSK